MDSYILFLSVNLKKTDRKGKTMTCRSWGGSSGLSRTSSLNSGSVNSRALFIQRIFKQEKKASTDKPAQLAVKY